MPLLRYFLFVGGALLALLMVVNACLPALPAAEGSPSAASDLSIIRIHSDRKWPDRIVFDTTRPTIVPTPAPQMAQAPQPPRIATVQPPKSQVREAFAQARTNELRNSEPRRKHRAVARNYAGQPPMNYFGRSPIVVAQQPRFGFFGNNIW
jgi:hypothetical protein